MSDLFCPATLVVARHAEAEPTDAQLRKPGGSLTAAGRKQAQALGESLRHERVAALWCSDMPAAVQTADIAASVLGVPVQVRAELRESGADNETLARVSDVLGEIADQFRGETVLIVSHGGAMRLALPALAGNVPASFARDRPLKHCDVCEVRVDADGWLLAQWAAERLVRL